MNVHANLGRIRKEPVSCPAKVQNVLNQKFPKGKQVVTFRDTAPVIAGQAP